MSTLTKAEDMAGVDFDLLDQMLEADLAEEDANDRRQAAIERLESFALGFLGQLGDALPDFDDDETAPKAGTIRLEMADRQSKSKAKPTKTLVFSSRRSSGCRNIAVVLRVVDLCHEALVSDIPTTKRDMFYKDPTLFRQQSVVDQIVDDLAATFAMDRSDLHVRASSKGLFAGSGLTIYLRQGGSITGSNFESSLIPCDAEIGQISVSEDVSWVLVVEKEAVFQTLCRLGFPAHSGLQGRGILVTGKGYPDVATRELLNRFSDCLPKRIPILALVDADPHGLDILSVFKYGSSSMDHQRKNLVSPRIKWIGVLSSELSSLGVQSDDLMPLNASDYKKALSMLHRPDMPKEWRRELTHMLHMRRKAEIEIICSATASVGLTQFITGPALLAAYLTTKVGSEIGVARLPTTEVVKTETRE